MKKDQIEKLRTLIMLSPSFNETEKNELIQKIPELTSEKITEAIRIFEDEQAKLCENNEKNIKYFQEFAVEKERDLKKMSQAIISNEEINENKTEIAEAENLLNSI